MKMKSSWTVFTGFAAVGAIVGAAVPASAWSVRQNGAFCMSDAGANVSHAGAGVGNNGTTIARLTCPVIDTSATPKTGITALGVSVQDNTTTGSVQATACVQLAALDGGRCGAATSTSVAGTGTFSLSPSRAQWAGANDLPYLLVVLPGKTGAISSFLFGYTFSG